MTSSRTPYNGPPFLPPRRYFAAGREKRPGNPISLVSADLRWPRGQPPMSHPASQAGPVPAPPASSRPAGTGDQQPGTAASPGIGVPLSVWPAAPAHGPAPGPGPEAAHFIKAFSRPGELVVIPAAGTGALLSAAAAAGRRVLGLFAGPAACHAAGLLEAGCPEAGQAALAINHRARRPRRRRRAVRGVRAGAAARRRAGRHHRQHPPPGRAAR